MGSGREPNLYGSMSTGLMEVGKEVVRKWQSGYHREGEVGIDFLTILFHLIKYT